MINGVEVVIEQSTVPAIISASFELSNLDGINGGDFSGRLVSNAGDVNGDGLMTSLLVPDMQTQVAEMVQEKVTSSLVLLIKFPPLAMP